MTPSLAAHILVLALAAQPDAPGAISPELAAMEKAAQSGDAAAQLAYGKALHRREDDASLPLDARNAARQGAKAWIRKAANQGVAEAYHWLAYAGLEPNEASNYAKAAELGYAPAVSHALDALLFRAGPEADVAAAKRVSDSARKQGLAVGGDLLDTVDRCFAAGVPVIPAEDRLVVGLYDENVRKAELYANGDRVQRNLRLAMALVCHGSSVPAELVAMVETLQNMIDGTAEDGRFTFCQHVTSALNGQFCLDEWSQSREMRQEQVLEEVSSGWSLDQRSALDEVVRAAKGFFVHEAEATAATPEETPHYAETPLQEQAVLFDAFVERLRQLKAGPPRSDRTFAAADRELNVVWSRLQRNKQAFWPVGLVDRAELGEAQRKWVAYRDAWPRLGKALYPGTSPELWKAWVTRQRIEELGSYLESADQVEGGEAK